MAPTSELNDQDENAIGALRAVATKPTTAYDDIEPICRMTGWTHRLFCWKTRKCTRCNFSPNWIAIANSRC